MKQFDKFNDAHKQAAISIIEAVKKEFPKGTIIDVSIHGARIIRAEVISHSSAWWHDPGVITILNLKSRKQRRFNIATISDESITKISTP